MSSNTTTSGACSSSSLRNAQPISSADVADVALTQQRADRRRSSRIDRQHIELLHDLDHRPVGDPRPVGQTAAPHHLRPDQRQRFGREPRLPDPRITHDRHQLTPLLPHRSFPSLGEHPELALPTHERRVMPALRCSMGREQPKRRHRLRLPLQRQRLDRFRVDRASHELVRRRSDQHLPRRRRLLKPRRHVHRISRHQPLRRARHHLTRVHADPATDPQRRQRIAHLHRRPTGTQRIVLMRLRDPEHRHHRITDELLHHPAMRLHNRFHPLEIPRKQRPQRLRIKPLAQLPRTRHDHRTQPTPSCAPHAQPQPCQGARRSSRNAGNPPASPGRNSRRPTPAEARASTDR